MACKFRLSEVALEWWRASGETTEPRLEGLVDNLLYVNNVNDKGERAAILADALANRHPWEV